MSKSQVVRKAIKVWLIGFCIWSVFVLLSALSQPVPDPQRFVGYTGHVSAGDQVYLCGFKDEFQACTYIEKVGEDLRFNTAFGVLGGFFMLLSVPLVIIQAIFFHNGDSLPFYIYLIYLIFSPWIFVPVCSWILPHLEAWRKKKSNIGAGTIISST